MVAQEGLLWIECKAESKPLEQHRPQALSMKRVSKASCNRRCFGKAPKIVVYATGTLGDIEAGFLSDTESTSSAPSTPKRNICQSYLADKDGKP